jgi:predicted NBD/HSP70 family sugar kinase
MFPTRGSRLKAYIAAHLKDMNRKVVYRLMEAEEVLSRSDISRLTGISAPTVMKIAAFLVGKGVLIEQGEGSSALGRKPMLLRFNSGAAYTVGVDYEGDHANIGLVDLKGKVTFFRKKKITCSFEEYFHQQLAGDIREFIQKSGADPVRILGMGIGIPGAIDSENNIIYFAPLIGVHEQKNLSSAVEKLSGEINMPVFVENDVNAAAVGEYVARDRKQYDDMVYITVGTGVGAGIIINGNLRKGIRFSAGEVGYMVFDHSFTTSKRSAGWLEGQVGPDLLKNRWDITEHGQMKSTDPASLEQAIEHTASQIGLCIANISTVLDARSFVVGGALTETLGERFFEVLKRYVSQLCLNETEIEHELCGKPTVVGMASIVRENMLDMLLVE